MVKGHLYTLYFSLWTSANDFQIFSPGYRLYFALFIVSSAMKVFFFPFSQISSLFLHISYKGRNVPGKNEAHLPIYRTIKIGAGRDGGIQVVECFFYLPQWMAILRFSNFQVSLFCYQTVVAAGIKSQNV